MLCEKCLMEDVVMNNPYEYGEKLFTPNRDLN